MYCNQFGIIENGLPLNITDAVFFSFLNGIIKARNTPKIEVEGKYYTLFRWQVVNEYLPILGITSQRQIIRLLNNLESYGLIERQIYGKYLYLALGNNAAELLTYNKNGYSNTGNYRYNLFFTPNANEVIKGIDLAENVIFHYLQSLFTSPDFEKKQVNGKDCIFFNYRLIVNQLPILGITSRQKVMKRINRLVKFGLIEKRMKYTMLYLALGNNAELLPSTYDKKVTPNTESTKQKNGTPMTKELHNLRQNGYATYDKRVTQPMTKELHNNILSNNKEEIINVEKNAKNATPPTMVEIKEHAIKEAVRILPEMLKAEFGVNYDASTIEEFCSLEIENCTLNPQQVKRNRFGNITKNETLNHLIKKAGYNMRVWGKLPLKFGSPQPVNALLKFDYKAYLEYVEKSNNYHRENGKKTK